MRIATPMRAILLAAALVGCVSTWQDGHFDACNTFGGDAGAMASGAYSNDCNYDHPFAVPGVEDNGPDAYEKGFLAGLQDCTNYDETWLSMEAAQGLCPGVGPEAGN